MSTKRTKKGDTPKCVITGGINGDTITIPAGAMIENIVTKKIGTTAGNLYIGTARAVKPVYSFTFTAGCTSGGNITIALDDEGSTQRTTTVAVSTSDTTAQVATKVAAGNYTTAGFTAAVDADNTSKVIFTSTSFGARDVATFTDTGTTSVTCTVATVTAGVTGGQVVAKVTLGGTDAVIVDQTLLLKMWSTTANTTLYVDIDSAASADIMVFMKKMTW